MSFRVPSPAAAAELQNHNTKIDFAILEAAWRKSPKGLFDKLRTAARPSFLRSRIGSRMGMQRHSADRTRLVGKRHAAPGSVLPIRTGCR